MLRHLHFEQFHERRVRFFLLLQQAVALLKGLVVAAEGFYIRCVIL